MVIDRISSHLLENNESPALAQRILDSIVGVLPGEPTIAKLKVLLESDIENVETALGRGRSSAFTARLAELDGLRDAAYVALRGYAEASTNRPKVAEAGKLVYDIFRERGLTIHRLGYAQQTTELRILFDLLDSEEAKAAVETIGATTWLEDLKEAQEEFERVFQERAGAQSQASRPQLVPARTRLHRNLDTLLRVIECLYAFAEQTKDYDTAENLSDAISIVNEHINELMSIARARRTREDASNESDAETKDTEEVENALEEVVAG